MTKIKKKETPPDIQGSRESVPATALQNGRFIEEYLSALQTVYGARVYRDMARSDYQIVRLLRVLTAPILSAKFEYVPIDADDQDQVKQAKFKNKLWTKDWGKRTWNQTLFEFLTYLKYGHMVAEPYAHVVNDSEFGKVITLRNIGSISPISIREWDIQGGEVKRILQQTSLPDGNYFEKWIDGSSLIILTNEQEGDNFEGISVLRGIYGNYIRKELYLRIDMIGVEKMAVGTPVVFAPQYLLNNKEEMAKLQQVLGSYCAHENQFVILPTSLRGNEKEKGFYIEKGEYNSEAVQNSIMREDTATLDAVLASFLNIGVYRSGGNSQNEGQMGLFLNSLLSVANYIAENRDEIAHQYFVLNFGEPKVKLTTKVSGITQDDAMKAMEILRGYIMSDAIRPDDRLEKFTRDKLNLPEADISTARQLKPDPTDEANSDPSRKTKEKTTKPQSSPQNPKKEGH